MTPRPLHGGMPGFRPKRTIETSVAAVGGRTGRSTARSQAFVVPSTTRPNSISGDFDTATLRREGAPHAADWIVASGCDPGLAHVGFAKILWSPHAIRLLVLKTIATESKHSVQQRCSVIRLRLDEAAFAFAEHTPEAGCIPPEVLCIEEQARAWQGKQQQGKSNANSTKARVGEGVIRCWADLRSIEVLELTPQQIRVAIGVPGNCPKEQLGRFACARAGVSPEIGSGHARDALAMAIAGAARFSILRRLRDAREQVR